MIRRLGVWKERQSFDRGLNEARVYRNLGIFFLRRGHFQDKNRARSFLKAALIQGDEKAYLIYHFHFSKRVSEILCLWKSMLPWIRVRYVEICCRF